MTEFSGQTQWMSCFQAGHRLQNRTICKICSPNWLSEYTFHCGRMFANCSRRLLPIVFDQMRNGGMVAQLPNAVSFAWQDLRMPQLSSTERRSNWLSIIERSNLESPNEFPIATLSWSDSGFESPKTFGARWQEIPRIVPDLVVKFEVQTLQA